MSCWTDFMRSLQNRHPLLGSNFKAEILPHHYGKVTGSQWLILRERAILWFYEKSRIPFWAGEQKYNWKSGLIGLFGSKWTSKIISLQPPSIYRGTFHLTRLLQGLSNLLLNTSRSGTSTVCPGKLAQWLTTHRVKNFFQISNLILPFYSLKTFSLTVSLHPLVKSAFPALLEGLEVLEGSLSSLYPPLLQGEQPQFPQPATKILGIFVASSGVTPTGQCPSCDGNLRAWCCCPAGALWNRGRRESLSLTCWSGFFILMYIFYVLSHIPAYKILLSSLIMHLCWACSAGANPDLCRSDTRGATTSPEAAAAIPCPLFLNPLATWRKGRGLVWRSLRLVALWGLFLSAKVSLCWCTAPRGRRASRHRERGSARRMQQMLGAI